MLRFDKDRDGHIKYSEFCDAFLPIDSFHASLLAKKAPLNTMPLSNLPRTEVFYSDTRKVFGEAWKVVFQNEIENDKLRICSQRRSGFSSHDAFLALDVDHDSYLDKDDVSPSLLQSISSFGYFSREGASTSPTKNCAV